MANLRSQIRQRHGLTVAPVERPPARRRWPLIGGIGVVVLLALAWVEGGETPLRPLAEPVPLPEQP